MPFPIYFSHIKTKLTIDRAGRVLIPKATRDRMHLSSGDTLAFETREDAIVLRPVREEPTMFKKDGMWVIKTGKPITIEDFNAMVEAIREERDRHISGPWPK